MPLRSARPTALAATFALVTSAGSVACAPEATHDGAAERAPASETHAAPIINGAESTASDYPSAGVLLLVAHFQGQSLGSMICTGTLIAPDVVLTAAHCTMDLFGAGSGVTSEYYFSFALDVASFGQTTMTLPADAVRVKRLVAHPDFDGNTQPAPGLGTFHDVGLLFLDAPITTVTPEVVADAADGAALQRGMEVAIAGYGQTSPTDQNSAGVKYHALTVLNEVGDSELQIGDRPPVPQKCHGDSGGPTYLDSSDGRQPARRVIGLTSRAYDESDCNRGGIDTRADYYRSWIDGELVAACSDGTRSGAICAAWSTLPVPGGVVVRPDAGPSDSGLGTRDAGAPDLGVIDAGVGGADAGSTAADAGAARDAAVGDGGRTLIGTREPTSSCACTAAGRAGERGDARGPGATSGALAVLAALGLVVRRRAGVRAR